jgi:peptidoglycan/LPS O-acetylase OafA/YrhL
MTPPPGAAHLPRFRALDGLRLVGALAVLTTHVGFESGAALEGRFAGLLSRLDVGVALFFVVSGFLLFRPHAMGHLQGHRRPRTAAYLVRRAARILPVLWLVVAAAWLLVREDAPVGDYLAHAFLVQIYVGTPQTVGLTQLWSLCTEVAFYLALPLVAALACRGPRDRRWVRRMSVAAGLLVVAGPAWMALVTVLRQSQARLWLPGFVGWFGLGMLLAVWHAARTTGVLPAGRLDRLAAYPGTLWGLAAALFVLASTPVAGPLDLSEPTALQAATKSLLYAVIGALVVLPTVLAVPPSPEPTAVRALSGRVGVGLGLISYGVFAYHVLILELVSRWLGLATFEGGFWQRWLLTAGLAVAVAAVSYVVVERPVMRRVRRLPSVGRRRPSPSATHSEAVTPSHTPA